LAKASPALPQRPRRTVRVVLWGAEEIGKAGEAFAKVHGAQVSDHVIASESDFGAGPVLKIALPKNKGGEGFAEALIKVLGPAGVVYDRQDAVNGGADVEEMAELGMPVASLRQNGLDYFDWHHTADDTLDKVKANELDQNVAVWAAFAWMVADSAVTFRSPAVPAK
jgi:Zn-dependent M28 family amino/carboxypeptidase